MQRFDLALVFTSFEGRISRLTFWLGTLTIGAIHTILQGAVDVAGGDLAAIDRLALTAVLAYPILALYVKRCHDRGKSGWWCAMLAIPVFGMFWAVIELGLLSGEPGDNTYGGDPLLNHEARDAV